MAIFQNIFAWAYGFLQSGNIAVNLLNQTIFDNMTMLSLLTISGLVIYLGIAVTKWLIS